MDAGIAVIEQETAIAPHLTVAENMYLGCEPKKANGLLDRKKMEADAQAVLDEMGLDVVHTHFVQTDSCTAADGRNCKGYFQTRKGSSS